jgi:hypothetical protein
MRYIKDRMIVINAYGGKCEKCGFQDFRALQFDHVQGGGSKDLKGKSPTAIRKALMPVNKEKFALLCANCNWKRRYTDIHLPRNANVVLIVTIPKIFTKIKVVTMDYPYIVKNVITQILATVAHRTERKFLT